MYLWDKPGGRGGTRSSSGGSVFSVRPKSRGRESPRLGRFHAATGSPCNGNAITERLCSGTDPRAATVVFNGRNRMTAQYRCTAPRKRIVFPGIECTGRQACNYCGERRALYRIRLGTRGDRVFAIATVRARLTRREPGTNTR